MEAETQNAGLHLKVISGRELSEAGFTGLEDFQDGKSRESGLQTPPTKRNPSHKSLGTSLDISTVVGNGTTLVIIPVVSNRSTS